MSTAVSFFHSAVIVRSGCAATKARVGSPLPILTFRDPPRSKSADRGPFRLKAPHIDEKPRRTNSREAQGLRIPKAYSTISTMRCRLGAGIKVTAQRNRWSHDPNSLSATDLAARLNIPVNWLYVQIRQKRLLIDRQPTGAHLFRNSPSVMDAIRNLRNHAVSHIDLRLRICQPHQEGHQHA